MSSAANITVKKNDGSTDVVYSVLQGMSGTTPAQYKAPALGATPATQPELRVHSRQNQSNVGKVIATFMYPYSVVNSTTGLTSIEKRETFRLEYTGSLDVPQATRDEAASQGMNLLASSAFKTMLKELMAAV